MKSVSNDHSFVFHVSVNLDDCKRKCDDVKTLLVDCGATTHIITDKSKFVEFDETFKPANHFIELANGSKTNNLAQGKGTANVSLVDSHGHTKKAMLKNALYVPSFKQDIFSIVLSQQCSRFQE